MDQNMIQTYLLAKRHTTEETPFGPECLVYKVMGKMYAILMWQDDPLRITLKCDPQHAVALRAIFPAVQPGYHCNKQHWNTITLNGSVSENDLREWMDESYTLVVRGLPRFAQEILTKGA